VRLFKIILLNATILSPAVAYADEGGTETIVVTANKAETPLSQVGQSVTIIDAEAIETKQAVLISDLLRDVPGVAIARNGGVGTQTSVFIRGSDSDQTAVLIDGVKLNDPSSTGGGFDFGRLLVNNINRVEVVRGAQSVLWGSQAIGGVINVITQQPDKTLSVKARTEYGFRDTGQVVGNISGKTGPVALGIGGGYFRTNGISVFSENRGGIERDGFEQFAANASAAITITDALSVDVRGWYADVKTEFDGGFPFGDTRSFNKTRQFVGYGGLNLNLLDGRFRNRVAVAYTDIDRNDFNPDATPQLQGDARGKNTRFEYQGIFDAADTVRATFGAETEKSSFRFASDFGFGASVDSGDATLNSVYGQISATPISGLTMAAGLRYNTHSDFGNATVFAANFVYSPNDGKTTIRGSYGEGFKAPGLYQLFSIYGNTLLQPETSKGWEASIAQTLIDGAVEVGATWYDRKSRNQIGFINCGPQVGICTDRPFGTYNNIDRTRAQGLEFGLSIKPADALQFQFNYTLNKAVDVATNAQLLRRPRHAVNAAIDYRWSFGLKTGISVAHRSKSNDSDFEAFPFADVQLPSYDIVDIRTSFPLNNKIELYGRVDNVFDATYETALRYGSLGRAAYVGVRFGF
jgi:vitamin B12 transporter